MRAGDERLLAPGEPSAAAVVTGDGVAAVEDDVLVVVHPRRVGRLRRRGWAVVRYRAYTRAGATVYRTQSRRAGAGRRCRDLDIVVASRHGASPGIVSVAAGDAALEQVAFADDPRRRASFVVRSGGRRMIVKVSRGAMERGRAAREQEVLGLVTGEPRLAANVPRPLGRGDAWGHEWSMETWATGVVMRSASRRWQRQHGRATLDRLACWLTELAVATADPPNGAGGDTGIVLTDQIGADLAGMREQIPDVVRVLAHGDLASGENLLVRESMFTVIDWETADPRALPLLDLVPTLSLGLARFEAAPSAREESERVLRLCRGEAPASQWFFTCVRRYLDALDLPLVTAGPLAALAWGHQASMRARHDALVVAGVEEVRPWVSPAELVYERWMTDAWLGTSWSAFLDASLGPAT